MEILPEDRIEFLDVREFYAKKIVVVGKSYARCKRAGSRHMRDRMIAKDAYCYEAITYISLR